MYVTEVIEACAELEAHVAQIYRGFATRFTENRLAARLWRELALEEETHADVLRREHRAFNDRDEAGPFLSEYDHWVETLRGRVHAIEGRAASCSLDEAFEIASEIERCGIEEIYEDLVVQADPAFKLLSERLESVLSSLPAHQERLSRATAEHQRGRSGQLPRS